MKTLATIFFTGLTIFYFQIHAQNIGINGNGNNAHPSALLDIDAVATPSLGVLMPRIALQAINVSNPVSSPATSLLVYNTATASSGSTAVTPGYYYWDGAQWVRFAYNPSGTSATAWNISGNAGTTAGTHFIGTTDAQDVVFKTNNLEAVRITTAGNMGVGTTTPSVKFYAKSLTNICGALESNSNASGLNSFQLQTSLTLLNTDQTNGNNIGLWYGDNNPGSALAGISAVIQSHAVGAKVSDLIFFNSEVGAQNAQRMIIKSNGNVGINVLSPTTAKLMVSSTSNTFDGITSNHTSGSTASAYHAVKGDLVNGSYTSAAGYLGYHNSSNLTYGVYATGGNYAGTFLNKTYIGNLQPNTTINTADLEVSNIVGGSNPANLTLRQSTSITAASTDMAYLNFADNYTSSPQASIRAIRDLASSSITDLPTSLTFHTISDGTATLSERMRIDNGGKVGIGTTLPTYNLDVIAATGTLSTIRVYDAGAFGGTVLLGNMNHGITRGNGTTSFSFAMMPNDVALYTTSGNLFLGSGTPSVPRLTIDNTGNVGIGHTTPPYKLTVNAIEPTMAIAAYIANSPSLTANSATNFHGAWNTVIPNSSFNFTGDLYGAVNRINTGLSQTGSIGGLIGATNDVLLNSSASITNARGSSNVISNYAGGSVTNAYGAFNEIQNSGGGTITNGYGLMIGAVQAINKWSIYAGDGTTQNYFAGNLSVGVPTTTYKFQVAGTANCTSGTWTSDQRKKQNIQPFTQNALDIVGKLKPVSFEWKEVIDDGMKGTQIGFIAQDLEQVLPSMVVTANNDEQSKSVKYNELLSIYAKAIQELNQKLEDKTKDIEILKKQYEEILQLLKQK